MSKERELMEVLNKENSNFRFYKKKDNDKIWSVEEIGYIGKLLYYFLLLIITYFSILFPTFMIMVSFFIFL